MGPQRENNRLVRSDMSAKKSELFTQILLIICYELFIGNFLSSHSIGKIKSMCILKIMTVIISFIKSKLWL